MHGLANTSIPDTLSSEVRACVEEVFDFESIDQLGRLRNFEASWGVVECREERVGVIPSFL